MSDASTSARHSVASSDPAQDSAAAAGREYFARVLHRLEFERHRTHRWLLLRKQQREAILNSAGLLSFIRWDDNPVHLGDIVRVKTEYDWGHVVFRSGLAGLDPDQPCSVYAAFEFLIRECGHFPTFISISDLYACGKQDHPVLPVYGAACFRADVEGRQLQQMLKVSRVRRRDELLVHQAYEICDQDLFKRYFDQSAAQAKPN